MFLKIQFKTCLLLVMLSCVSQCWLVPWVGCPFHAWMVQRSGSIGLPNKNNIPLKWSGTRTGLKSSQCRNKKLWKTFRNPEELLLKTRNKALLKTFTTSCSAKHCIWSPLFTQFTQKNERLGIFILIKCRLRPIVYIFLNVCVILCSPYKQSLCLLHFHKNQCTT